MPISIFNVFVFSLTSGAVILRENKTSVFISKDGLTSSLRCNLNGRYTRHTMLLRNREYSTYKCFLCQVTSGTGSIVQKSWSISDFNKSWSRINCTGQRNSSILYLEAADARSRRTGRRQTTRYFGVLCTQGRTRS